MKTFLTLVAALAAATTVSAASAHDRGPGHWEWQSRSTFGPNKSNAPSRVRVWIRDAQDVVASCDCPMMKDHAADCMMDMRGKGKAPSAG
jgi:hypothetical protein